MWKTLIVYCYIVGILNVYATELNESNKLTATKQITDDTTSDIKADATAASSSPVIVTVAAAEATVVAKESVNDATKDKRQTKDTKNAPVYANHRRSDNNVNVIQHFAYLQDLASRQPKVLQSKALAGQNKKLSGTAARAQAHQASAGQVEEAEQRYAVAVEQPILTHARSHLYQPQLPYHLGPEHLQQHHHQQQQQQQQQQHPQEQSIQIIPEEQFLKILEAELKARALQEDQYRRQEAAAAAAAASNSQKAQGLGGYRQRIDGESDINQHPDYLQYIPQHNKIAGPKYLPLPSAQGNGPTKHIPEPEGPPQLPPQIAYYQPQISYKTLPNHPLAKSSLENEIEKLLANNKPHVAPVQIVDSTNEPSAVVNHRHPVTAIPAAPLPKPRLIRPHLGAGKSYATTLGPHDNQPFLPSLYQFGNYPLQVPQEIIDAKKLGPVVYPPQQQQPQPSSSQPQHQPQPQLQTHSTRQPPIHVSQFFYQEPTPTPAARPKSHRSKYGTKLITTPLPTKPLKNDLNYPLGTKYAQPIFYEIEKPNAAALAGHPQFYPSPPDPHRSGQLPIPAPTVQPTAAASTKYAQQPQADFRQYALPGTSPSQSSIYVSQGTGIVTASRPIANANKPKTIEDLKQLHLPQPGGKPLTQAEFQALVDAGYPVTAVPVPIPVPYDQYVKDHPEFRNQPPPALPVNYEQLMRFAQLQQHHQARPQRQHHPQQQQQQFATRSYIGRASEPSVKIISSPSEPQSATVTYLKPLTTGGDQKRRPRDEAETKVLGTNISEEDKKQVIKMDVAKKDEKNSK
uniref:Zasp-like motif domain-containing protein n=1 Tax=Glossina brevipalpis TaxID=37001 RepID=A0A1A9WDZ8_9MUSC